jgi:putative alpha-1,2-mannosidase
VYIKGGDEARPYIQSARLNGAPFDRTWISWDSLSKGAVLDFMTGERPNKAWGTKTDPPSFN